MKRRTNGYAIANLSSNFIDIVVVISGVLFPPTMFYILNRLYQKPTFIGPMNSNSVRLILDGVNETILGVP